MRWNWMWWSGYRLGTAQAHSPLRANVFFFPFCNTPLCVQGKCVFLFNYMCAEPAGQSVLPKGGWRWAVSGSVGNSSGLAPLAPRVNPRPSGQTVNAVELTLTVLWLQGLRFGPRQQRWRRSCTRCLLPTQSSSAVLQEATPGPRCAGLRTASLSARRTAWEGIR